MYISKENLVALTIIIILAIKKNAENVMIHNKVHSMS